MPQTATRRTQKRRIEDFTTRQSVSAETRSNITAAARRAEKRRVVEVLCGKAALVRPIGCAQLSAKTLLRMIFFEGMCLRVV